MIKLWNLFDEYPTPWKQFNDDYQTWFVTANGKTLKAHQVYELILRMQDYSEGCPLCGDRR